MKNPLQPFFYLIKGDFLLPTFEADSRVCAFMFTLRKDKKKHNIRDVLTIFLIIQLFNILKRIDIA